MKSDDKKTVSVAKKIAIVGTIIWFAVYPVVSLIALFYTKYSGETLNGSGLDSIGVNLWTEIAGNVVTYGVVIVIALWSIAMSINESPKATKSRATVIILSLAGVAMFSPLYVLGGLLFTGIWRIALESIVQ